jgi:hypothetical protein
VGSFGAVSPRRSPAARLLGALLVALACAPALAAGALVARHAVDVPVWDDWERAPLADKWAEGRLRARDLYAPHLEHRIVLPRLFMLANLELTHGDLRVENAVAFAFLLAGGTALAALARRTLGSRALAAVGLASAVFFSPLQWENLLWAIQLAFVISLACIPVTMLVLASPLSPRARFAACLGLALLATHSFGHGLLLWPAVAAYVALEPGGRRKPVFLTAWLVAAALVLVPYFTAGRFRNESLHAYERPVGEAPPAIVSADESLAQGERALRFGLAMVGSPLARIAGASAPAAAPWLGAGLLALFAVAALGVWRSGRFGAALPWLGIGGTAVAACAVTAVGRSSLIFEQYALIPHYVSVSTQLVVALVGLGALLLPRAAAAVGVLVLLAMLVPAWQAGAEGMWVWEQARLRARVALVYADHLESRFARRIDWDQTTVRKWAGMLDRHGYLDPPLAKAPTLAPFELEGRAMDSATGIQQARLRDGMLRVRGLGGGHGVLLVHRDRAGEARVVALGESWTPVRRPTAGWEHVFDFVEEHGARDAGRWEAEIPLASLPEGRKLWLEAWAVDARAMRAARLPQRIVLRRRGAKLGAAVEPWR